MTWSGKFGPSAKVETKLNWNNPACKELYLTLKDRYHDKLIPGISRCLYYHFGAIGLWGKAGFRISGHTKTSDEIGQSETLGILRVEN